MKAILFTLVLALQSLALAGGHEHHPPHNMVLFGEADTFASHIVYKVPHNFQVILKVNLEASVKAKYLQERQSHPQDLFIFLLDSMDIKEIQTMTSISGTISRTDSTGAKIVLARDVQLKRPDFSVLFFNELPLSLESKPH